jgi:alcohol dehydrogenase (NADP+)
MDMLKPAAEKGVKPWFQEVPINEDGCIAVLIKCKAGDARFRFVFTEFDMASD